MFVWLTTVRRCGLSGAIGEGLTMSTAEFARATGFARRTVQLAVQQGRLRAIRLVRGGGIRILRSELERLVNGGRRQRSHMAEWHKRRDEADGV